MSDRPREDLYELLRLLRELASVVNPEPAGPRGDWSIEPRHPPPLPRMPDSPAHVPGPSRRAERAAEAVSREIRPGVRSLAAVMTGVRTSRATTDTPPAVSVRVVPTPPQPAPTAPRPASPRLVRPGVRRSAAPDLRPERASAPEREPPTSSDHRRSQPTADEAPASRPRVFPAPSPARRPHERSLARTEREVEEGGAGSSEKVIPVGRRGRRRPEVLRSPRIRPRGLPPTLGGRPPPLGGREPGGAVRPSLPPTSPRTGPGGTPLPLVPLVSPAISATAPVTGVDSEETLEALETPEAEPLRVRATPVRLRRRFLDRVLWRLA